MHFSSQATLSCALSLSLSFFLLGFRGHSVTLRPSARPTTPCFLWSGWLWGPQQTEALNYVVGSPPLNWQAPPVTLTNPNWPRPRAPLATSPGACLSEQLVEPSCHCIRPGSKLPAIKGNTVTDKLLPKTPRTLTCVNQLHTPPRLLVFSPVLEGSQNRADWQRGRCAGAPLAALALSVSSGST